MHAVLGMTGSCLYFSAHSSSVCVPVFRPSLLVCLPCWLQVQSPYLRHDLPGSAIETLRFRPYEDVLGVAHRDGFVSMGQSIISPLDTRSDKKPRNPDPCPTEANG